MEISLAEFVELTKDIALAEKVESLGGRILDLAGRSNEALRILRKLEEQMSTQAQALARLQTDVAALQTQATTLQQTILDANGRLQAIIDALKNSIAGDVTPDLNKLADALEGVNASLVADTTAEQAVGVTKLVVSPMTANVAPGGSISFSANIAVKWSTVSGSIDQTGVYTAPASGAASDTVTATSVDTQTAVAVITIG